MKWFWLIQRCNMVSNPFVADNIDYVAVSKADVESGILIQTTIPCAILRATVESNDGQPDDVLLNDDMILVFSLRLKEALEKSNIVGVQYLPVAVMDSNQRALDGYYIANITCVSECLDLENAIYTKFPEDETSPRKAGKVSALAKPALKKAQLPNADVFRLSEQLFYVFVSERFAAVFKKHKFTGAAFKQIQVS